MARGNRPILPQFMATVTQGARQRLDAMSEMMPPMQPAAEPLDQYMAKAVEYAQRDPEFAARLGTSLEQYKRLGG